MTEPAPTPAAQASLMRVDRAVAELRRGGTVVVVAGEARGLVVQAAETVGPETVDHLRRLAGSEPALALTGRRAAVLNLADEGARVVTLKAEGGLAVEVVSALADPCGGAPTALPEGVTATVADARGDIGAAVDLAKIGRLLPAAVVATVTGADDLAAFARDHELASITVDEIETYDGTAARTLRRVSEARVPLAGAEDTRVVAFRPADGGIEHLALLIGRPEATQPALVRLHSECFTGDLLGSLRCDCGDQLRGAIATMGEQGAGVLLYLAQEGRGIGLVNKLRAYRLQDQGHDTLDANEQLGFDDDERVYLPAAEMLRQLGLTRIRLMTNNPQKVEGLMRHGIEVVERVPHVFPANEHNAHYLQTKAVKGGHLF